MLKWTRQQQHLSLQLLHSSVSNPQQNFPPTPKTSVKKRYSSGNFPRRERSSKPPIKMPTMTHTLERRLHRRSLDNHLDSSLEDRRRSLHSLTGNHNKENFGVHFMRQSFGNTSLSALQDLSNGKSPRRSNEETPPAPAITIKRRNLRESTVAMPTTPPSNDFMASRFSDDFAPEDDLTPLSRLRFRNKIKEDSLSSSRMGDVTLDRMLDAIIESARKDVKPVGGKQKPKAEDKENDKDESIHEMEVRTPQHLKRQRVVRRKNHKHTDKKGSKEKAKERLEGQAVEESLAEIREVVKTAIKPQQSREMIGLTLPNGIPSPETPTFPPYPNQKSLLNMDTPPRHSMFEVDSSVQRCSTPTVEETQSIKRCLSFSCASEEDDDASSFSNSKRGSVASSIASSTNEQLSGSCSSTSLNIGGRGSLDVAIYLDNETLNVHVIRCRDLQRSNGTSANTLNAYVKVALIRESQNDNQYFQRTVVHRHSNRPYFDHCFKFDLSDVAQAVEEIDSEDRLQMAVWHRDRQLKRSEFLGCISFPLATLLQQQEINGSYKLQSQTCLNKPQPAIPELQQQQPQHQTPINHYACQQQRHTATATTATTLSSYATASAYQSKQHTMAAMTQMRNTDDAVSIDSMAAPVASSGGGLMDHHQQPPMILSKKALHQRDADENLFLRFLELDPPAADPVPTTPGGRRLSNSKPIGRTPFTMTKKLTRTVERGFGFSIVWTHPPRVEKVEPGLSADRCGILPGDYVIFVDKHNVVTMPEADVLNLIRSQGATLTLEIFRRSGSGTGAAATGSSHTTTTATTATQRSLATTMPMNGKTSRMAASGTSINNVVAEDSALASLVLKQVVPPMQRPPTACSVGTISSVEAAKRRLNLPQVTFSKESIAPITDNRRRFLLQLISREQNFMSALHFGMQRYVQPLVERKDLITPNDHRTLFQNMDELLRISEDVLEQLCHDDQEPQMNFASRVYLSKTTAICAAYKKYCNGIKRADCVLVNKSRQTGSEFVAFITEPPVPRKRPDLTMFIHRPLQHFREILKLMQLLASNCHVDTEEHKNFNTVINELQAAYREITVTSGLMEPLGEGRPLLTLQDLESRMVFTKCKPFTLAVQGRQWIFGGDLSRVEGRSVKPYWTLLFSDIIVFAKVSRDRVLFITEEPIPIANIVDSCFHMRKKTTEFRLTVDPNGRLAESPTGYCAPDLTKTPKKGARRKSLVLRAPSLELKAVWQNLLQRQIFLVNAALGSTPLSSPLDSPDVLNTLVPLSDIGIASASIGSIKLSSMDSINLKNQQHNQQVRLMRSQALTGSGESGGGSFENLQRLASTLVASRCSTRMTQTTHNSVSCSSQTNSPATCRRTLGGAMLALGPPGDSATSLRSLALGRKHLLAQTLDSGRPLSACRAYNNSNNNSSPLLTCSGSSLNTQTICSGDHLMACKCLTAIPEAATETGCDGQMVEGCKAIMLKQSCGNTGQERYFLIDGEGHYCVTTASLVNIRPEHVNGNGNGNGNVHLPLACSQQLPPAASDLPRKDVSSKSSKLLEFSLSSVGRSFIDESDFGQPIDSVLNSLTTPDTPTPNLSPSLYSNPIREPDTFSNDFVTSAEQNHESSKKSLDSTIPLAQFGGSWDLLELDLNLHEVDLDTCYDTDVEEYIFHGDSKDVVGLEDDDDDDDEDDEEDENNRLTPQVSEQIEKLIDEKCRILNKTGTSKSSALHLANWMKGQLDKQQEQARLVVTRSLTDHSHVEAEADDEDQPQAEHDERITYWTRQQLEKRTKELNLAKENGHLSAKPNFGGKRLSGVDELSMSDVSHCEAVSQISQSHSTTSDSQITVRSSPIVLDKLAVCRHCHKNCQKSNKNALAAAPTTSASDQTHQQTPHTTDHPDTINTCPLSPTSLQKAAASGLVCHSLKVQHSQSSPHRCCKVNGSASRASSITSLSSGTVTGEKPAAHHHACSSSKRDVDDTESDVAQLLTDDNCPSETTVEEDDHGIARTGQTGHYKGPSEEATSSTTSSATSSTTSTSISSTQLEATATSTTNQDTDTDNGIAGPDRITGRVHSLRILDEHNEALLLTNGHCEAEEFANLDRVKPEPPPRKFMNISPKRAKQIEEEEKVNEMVKMSVTITETAKIVRIEQTSTTPLKTPRSPVKTPKSPKTPLTPKSDRSASSSSKSKQFVACTCKCLPEDFANATLSPEEVELQTCKMLESPKQSPKMPRSQTPKTREREHETEDDSPVKLQAEDPHRFCNCTCAKVKREDIPLTQEDREDDDLSLMLIGLAQLTPTAKLLNMTTPTAPMPTPTQTYANYAENGFVPTIAIVPATPDSVLTKTSTNVWDNSTHITTSTATTNLLISNIPRQAVIENIPEDSCDESPLDEEPPYRPMSNTLRRYGTMSSLEKLPSEDRLDNEYELDDDEDDDVDDVDDDDDVEVDDDDEELMDKARADNIELDNEIRVVTKAIYSTDEAGSSSNSTANAWTSRASTFVSGKMSFFEESRAFIDKYLGRWNQDQTDNGNPALTSDPEEQMDECTSGATSGEEVWGTPTSGGDNDDMHLANSENTHSSPTKSSNSLNDDDDTELMMDELLMAPPMSASTIRGLLPRRRLEPLFEEETESDEEKTQQESEELKKGETTTNGHYLEDSEAGSSSEEEEEEEGEEEEEDQVNTADYEEEDEDLTSTEERLLPHLQTTILGPRPLSNPLAGPTLPQAVLKASSCEYLLDQRLTQLHTTTLATTAEPITITATTPVKMATQAVSPIQANSSSTITTATADAAVSTTMITASTSTRMMTTTTTMTTTTMATQTTMTSCSLTASTTRTTPSPAVSLASTTISNVSDTIRSDKDVSSGSRVEEVAQKNEVKTSPRPAKFIPPPPPPRRLLLTQTNLKTSGTDTKTPPKAPQPQRKSGAFADSGSSGAATAGVACAASMATPTANTPAPQRTATKTKTTATPKSPVTEAVCATRNFSGNSQTATACDSTRQQQRLSSTTIETSLLSMVDRINSSSSRLHSTSSTTASMTRARGQAKPEPKATTRAATRRELEEELELEMEWMEREHERDSTSVCAQPGGVGSGLSPRLEMRLALNQDILGDEDLISYDPGPDLTTILVHDLSTFHRLTGRDLLNRSAMNRVQPKEAVISYSQQRNSKMDTPTVNRRPRPHLNSSNGTNTSCSDQTSMTMAAAAAAAPGSSMPFAGLARVAGVPQHLQPNRNTWSSSAFADRNRDGNASDANNSDDSKLSDLEILARREKIYCMSQLRSGSRAKTARTTTTMMMTAATTTTSSGNLSSNPLMRTTSTTSMAGASEEAGSGPKAGQRQRKIGRDESALMETGKASKLINFIKRRNSEVPSSANNSQTSLNDSNSSSTPQHKQPPMSPRKDNDKPSLNRRLWKQITKRRRSNSVSELVAS